MNGHWDSDGECDVWEIASCDVCGLHNFEVDWCGECGNCKAHCANYQGCEEQDVVVEVDDVDTLHYVSGGNADNVENRARVNRERLAEGQCLFCGKHQGENYGLHGRKNRRWVQGQNLPRKGRDAK